jgi:hypothetical protein
MDSHFVFPKWSNAILPVAGVTLAVAPLYAALVVAFGFSPRTTDVGYQPDQPVAYSHALHAGQLGIDCRYCHNTVESSSQASIPPTQTCMNCHTNIHKDSPKLGPVRDSYTSGNPIKWVRVHDLPDYSYFNHAAHVNRGVSCVSCHGRVDRMEIVYQHETLSMGWCLACHRNPEMNVRDPRLVTQLDWGLDLSAAQRHEIAIRHGIELGEATALSDDVRAAIGTYWLNHHDLQPSQDCSTCHR